MAIDSSAPKIVQDLACFLNGHGYLGKVSELKLPDIEKQVIEHQGSVAKFDVDTGKFNPLNATFKFGELNPDAMALVTKNNENVSLVFRGSQKDGNGNRQVIATMRGLMKKTAPGAYTPGEKMETDYEMNIRYYKLQIGTETIYEFDLENYVAKAKGKDLLSQVRSFLGW